MPYTLPDISGESNPMDYMGYAPNSGSKYKPEDEYQFRTDIQMPANLPAPTAADLAADRERVRAGQLNIDTGRTLQSEAARVANAPMPIEDRLLSLAHDRGGFKDMTEYMMAVRAELYKDAAREGLDISNPKDKQRFDQAVGKYVGMGLGVKPVNPKNVKELKDGTVFDMDSMKVIYRPQDALEQAMGGGAPSQPMSGAPMQDYNNQIGQYAPPQTPVQAPQSRMQRAIEAAHIDPRFASTDEGKAALAYEKSQRDYEGEATSISDSAIDAIAQKYIDTGLLPSLGMGKMATETKNKILNKSAEIMKSKGMTSEDQIQKQATYKSSQAELTKLQSQRGPMMAFATTAVKNLDLAEELSSKVGRTGSPILNSWVLAGKRSVLGDPEVSKFDAAIRTGINEYAKIVSTATGGGVTSDTARKEVEAMLNGAQTDEQVRAVISLLKKEIENRRTGYDEQIEATKNLMTGSKPKKSDKGSTDLQRKPISKGPHAGKMAELQPDGKWKVVE